MLSQNDVDIFFLLGFVKAMQYLSKFQICYGAQKFYGILEEGNACELNNFGHEEYPFDNLNQTN
jgi:hypothetical protein